MADRSRRDAGPQVRFLTASSCPTGFRAWTRSRSCTASDARLLSQIQGRTYAYIFGLVERFISAKMLDQGRAHALDDQHALEALVRFTNDEIKHQELFRRVEMMIGEQMPMGYRQMANPSDVARAVLAASTWAVLALTCHIELFVQSHYVESIVKTADLCPLFKDVFKYHWKDESQHVVLDELEWKDEHARLSPAQRDLAVDDLIALVAAVDGILQAQSAADAEYFVRNASRQFSDAEVARHQVRGVRRLSLAVHHHGRAASAFRQAADQHDDAGADGAHPGGAGADSDCIA